MIPHVPVVWLGLLVGLLTVEPGLPLILLTAFGTLSSYWVTSSSSSLSGRGGACLTVTWHAMVGYPWEA